MMNEAWGPDADREAEVLRQRARALALPRPASAAGTVEVLDFTVAGQRCALELRWVREVRPLKDLMPLPLAAQPSLGLVQLRGRMLPVIEIPGLIREGPQLPPSPGLLLVLGRSGPEFGVGIGAVHGLRAISPDEAARRGNPLQGWRPEVVCGVTAEGHVLLDGERLLSLPGSPAARPPGPAAMHNNVQ